MALEGTIWGNRLKRNPSAETTGSAQESFATS